MGVILIYVLLQRPPWFKHIFVEIYGEINMDNAR
jgi:hypothetical protein